MSWLRIRELVRKEFIQLIRRQEKPCPDAYLPLYSNVYFRVCRKL